MAYYYVKSGGTATGDGGRYASQQSGSFAALGASGYYDNVAAAISATTAPDLGDFICISDAHSYINAGTITWHNTDLNAVAGDLPLVFITVSDTHCEQYAIASSVQEDAQSNGDFNLTNTAGDDNKYTFAGIYVKTGDDVQFFGQSHSKLYDCTFESDTHGDMPLRLNYLGAELYNCTMRHNGTTNSQYIIYLAENVTMLGGAVIGLDASPDCTILYTPQKADLIGVDLSDSGATRLIALDNGKSDNGSARFINCELPSSLTTWVGSNSQSGGEFLFMGCGNSSIVAEYQYLFVKGNSQVEDETGIYRDESGAFAESGTKVSYKCVAGAEANKSHPFVFELPAGFFELSTAGEDTLRIFLASTATLTDQDVRVEVIYPDGTNKYQQNRAESASFDPFASGTTLTTDSGSTWKNGASDLSGYNEYYIDVDTSGDAGADCVPLIRVFVSTTDTIYFCSTVEVN